MAGSALIRGRAPLPLLVALVLGCAGFVSAPQVEPFRIGDVAGEGDAARRASTRLVLGGLDAEASGNASRGRSLHERALQVDPTNPYAFLALGDQSLAAGRMDEAEAYYQRALRLSSDRADAQAALGQLAIEKDLIEEAEEWLAKARESNPDSERVRELADMLAPPEENPDSGPPAPEEEDGAATS